jgi:hypothetical protein
MPCGVCLETGKLMLTDRRKVFDESALANLTWNVSMFVQPTTYQLKPYLVKKSNWYPGQKHTPYKSIDLIAFSLYILLFIIKQLLIILT